MSDIIIANIGPAVSSQFNELMVARRTPIVELTSVYGTSELRDVITQTGAGSVTNTGTEYLIATTAAATDSAILDSALRGRYEPGYAGETGLGIRIPTLPVLDQTAQWGLYDDDNGLFFGVNATAPYVGYRKDGVDTIITQGSWNVDTMDGNGPSGLTLDLTQGNVFQIVLTWYGYGVIEYRVVTEAATPGSPQQVVTVHRYVPVGQTSITDPNVPIRAEAANNGTATAFQLYVGGREYNIIGKYTPVYRVTSERRTISGLTVGSTRPTVSFRRKTVFPAGSGRSNSVQVDLNNINIISTVDLVYQVRLGGTLTGANFTGVSGIPSSETCLEVDVTASAITGGDVVFQGLVSGGRGMAGSNIREELLDFSLPTDLVVTLTVTNVGNNGSNTINTMFALSESW